VQVGQQVADGAALAGGQAGTGWIEGTAGGDAGRGDAPDGLTGTCVLVGVGTGGSDPRQVTTQGIEAKGGGALSGWGDGEEAIGEVVGGGGVEVDGRGGAGLVAVGVIGEVGGGAAIGAADQLGGAVVGVGGQGATDDRARAVGVRKGSCAAASPSPPALAAVTEACPVGL
jgi:hypothetical protein